MRPWAVQRRKCRNLPVSSVGRSWRDFVHVHLGLHKQDTLVRLHGGDWVDIATVWLERRNFLLVKTIQ